MAKTKIEWATDVWNPVTGCTKISLGCKNCYAETMSKRFGWPWNTAVLHHDRLDQPLHWSKPRLVFVCSMGDLFHEDVPFEFIESVLDVAAKAGSHTFMILTKRPIRMQEFIWWFGKDSDADMPQNIWLGVSVESQETADDRVDVLLRIPAACRFVSVEPMLENLDLMLGCKPRPTNLFSYIDWVICGGESGPGARPMHPDWARSIRDQCMRAGVPFFFKQWGEWAPIGGPCEDEEGSPTFWEVYGLLDKKCSTFHNYRFERIGKKMAGNLLDGARWEQYPNSMDAKTD